jgi:hypothetical protein
VELDMLQRLVSLLKDREVLLDARTVVIGDEKEERRQLPKLTIGVTGEFLESLVAIHDSGKIEDKDTLAHVTDGLEKKVIDEGFHLKSHRSPVRCQPAINGLTFNILRSTKGIFHGVNEISAATSRVRLPS